VSSAADFSNSLDTPYGCPARTHLRLSAIYRAKAIPGDSGLSERLRAREGGNTCRQSSKYAAQARTGLLFIQGAASGAADSLTSARTPSTSNTIISSICPLVHRGSVQFVRASRTSLCRRRCPANKGRASHETHVTAKAPPGYATNRLADGNDSPELKQPASGHAAQKDCIYGSGPGVVVFPPLGRGSLGVPNRHASACR
jgi:hypothetical protein